MKGSKECYLLGQNTTYTFSRVHWITEFPIESLTSGSIDSTCSHLTVTCCVNQAGTLGDNVPEKGFYTWLMREPQTLVWLPTLHRFIAAETGWCVFSAEKYVLVTR